MRNRSVLGVCACICVLVLTGGRPATAQSPEAVVSGFLNANGAKVALVHGYVDEADPSEPIVVLSDKALPADAIPFLPEKLVKAQSVHAIAFSISRTDKKLTNSYGKVYYPGKELGFGRVEDGEVTLVVTRLDATTIEGKIRTPKTVSFSDVSYSFEASFKVAMGKKK
jgi:hypothetical protein